MTEKMLIKFQRRLPSAVFKFIRNAVYKANAANSNLYLVGGAVRDLLINRPNQDIDLVLEGDALKFARELAGGKGLSAVFHPRFGTAKFRFDNFNVDIASARRELYIRPGALPSVYKGTINEDLARRDFTINAIAVRLSSPERGQIIDPYQGIQDLDSKLIRILHENSFVDDATRIFRAIRYEQRLNFSLEQNTLKLIERDIDMIDTLSADRIRHELQLFFLEHYPEKAIQRARQLGLLNRICPALKYYESLAKVYRRARFLFKPAFLPAAYICLLVLPLDALQLESLLDRYHFTKQQALRMKQTVELKNKLKSLGTRPDRWDIFSMLNDYEPMVIQINKIASNDNRLSRIINLYLDKLRYIKPRLTGKDLVALGVPEGPQVGSILNRLYIARINGDITTRTEEVETVDRLMRDNRRES